MMSNLPLQSVSPRWFPLLGIALLALVMASPAMASVCPDPEIHGRIANTHVEGTVIFWEPLISYERLIVRVSAPCGDFTRTFKEGETPFFDLADVTREVDGRYVYELITKPRIDPAVEEQLVEVRGTPEEQMVVLELWDKGMLPRGPFHQAGYFHVVKGVIADPILQEEGSKGSVSSDGGLSARFPGSDGSNGSNGGVETASGSSIRNISAADFVIADDLIVDGSACIGFDCVNGESFGFDTIRLKENNLRIKFDDTSTAASFPRNDWQITANDSANGGASKFSIDDISGSRTPFTIEANARSHSLYVDDGGRIGIRTSTPSTEIHVIDGDTPALRLQQDGSSGFAPQTWDVAGNETNFFIRDVTNGSTLPLRIRPGADSNAIFIDVDNNVGLGTSSPDEKLHMTESGDVAFVLDDTSTGGSRWLFKNNTANGAFVVTADAGGGSAPFKVFPGVSENTLVVGSAGGADRVGINRSPGSISHPLHVGTDSTNGNGAHVTAGGVWTNGSSRASKNDITSLSAVEAIQALRDLTPVRFRYKGEPTEEYVGFIAEDVPELVAQSDRKTLSPMDIVAVLTKVVQQQQETIDLFSTKEQQLELLRAENASLRAMVEEVQGQTAVLLEQLHRIESQQQLQQ